MNISHSTLTSIENLRDSALLRQASGYIELAEFNMTPENSVSTPAKKLLQNANRTDVRLYAINSPFAMKDVLKAKGYRWSSEQYRAWYIDLPEKDIAEELLFLEKEIYRKDIKTLPMKQITAKLRYSNRI